MTDKNRLVWKKIDPDLAPELNLDKRIVSCWVGSTGTEYAIYVIREAAELGFVVSGTGITDPRGYIVLDTYTDSLSIAELIFNQYIGRNDSPTKNFSEEDAPILTDGDESKYVCIYRNNCVYGSAAAAVATRFFQDRVETVPYSYGESLPPVVNDRHVILVDLVISDKELISLSERCRTVTIIGHQSSLCRSISRLADRCVAISNYRDLTREKRCTKRLSREFKNIFYFINPEEIAAVTLWEFFEAPSEMPRLFVILNDHAMRTGVWSKSRAYRALRHRQGISSADWNNILESFASADLELEGSYLENIQRSITKDFIPRASWNCSIFDMNVLAVNCPNFLVGNAILEPLAQAINAKFSMCYWNEGKNTLFSLKSIDKCYDVSRVAETFGGGGSWHSAGFVLEGGLDEALERVLQDDGCAPIRYMKLTGHDKKQD